VRTPRLVQFRYCRLEFSVEPRAPIEAAMAFPLQVTFRNMSSSAALEERIRSLAGKLERFSSQITQCHVVRCASSCPPRAGRLVRLSDRHQRAWPKHCHREHPQPQSRAPERVRCVKGRLPVGTATAPGLRENPATGRQDKTAEVAVPDELRSPAAPLGRRPLTRYNPVSRGNERRIH